MQAKIEITKGRIKAGPFKIPRPCHILPLFGVTSMGANCKVSSTKQMLRYGPYLLLLLFLSSWRRLEGELSLLSPQLSGRAEPSTAVSATADVFCAIVWCGLMEVVITTTSLPLMDRVRSQGLLVAQLEVGGT